MKRLTEKSDKICRRSNLPQITMTGLSLAFLQTGTAPQDRSFTLLLVLDLAEWDIILLTRFFENGVPTPVTTIAGGAYLSKRKTTRYNRLKRHKPDEKEKKFKKI
ncbi:MAG: hypothetical protein HS129_07315 [Leptospiraceae bacterium]|nr:hypothetical protein [Leptospiraceae bacterium]